MSDIKLVFMDGSYWVDGPDGLERIPDMGMVNALREDIIDMLGKIAELQRRVDYLNMDEEGMIVG